MEVDVGVAVVAIEGSKRLRALDADIFISFAQSRMHTLRSMAAEVDLEYARDPAAGRERFHCRNSEALANRLQRGMTVVGQRWNVGSRADAAKGSGLQRARVNHHRLFSSAHRSPLFTSFGKASHCRKSTSSCER
jgi:hypothetical protein